MTLRHLLNATIATALGALCIGANAQAVDPHALIERIVQCKASVQEVAAFNHLLDDHKLSLHEAPNVSGWSSHAWRLDRPITFGGVSSDTVIMNSRTSLYLRAKSDDPRAGVLKAATELDLYKTLDSGDSLVYDDTTGDARTQAMTSDEKGVYWVGCAYDSAAFERQMRNDETASPAGAARKQAARRALGN